MSIHSKYNGNTKMSLLQMLLKSTLVVGLSACNSPASQSNNVSEKGKKSMINEILNSQIKPDHVLQKQENRNDINIMVFKYFQIGESKQEVVSKLHQMGAGVQEESNGKVIKTGRKESGLFGGDWFAEILNITFKFDHSDKLLSVESMYFTQE